MQTEQTQQPEHMQKRSCEEASGVPLHAAKLRRGYTLEAAKDTLSHLYSANHFVTADVASEQHRGWLKLIVSAVEETVKLLENTDTNAAPEEPLQRTISPGYSPTSPAYSPTSPEYDPCEEPLNHPPKYEDDEPVYAVLRGPAAEPQRMDAVEVHTLHRGVKPGVLIGKDRGQGIVKFPNGNIEIHAMSDIQI